MHPHSSPSVDNDIARSFLGAFGFSARALELMWNTSHALTIALGVLTLVAGLLPAGIAWVGAQIVDAVVSAAQLVRAGSDAPLAPVLWLVALEGGLVAAMAGGIGRAHV